MRRTRPAAFALLGLAVLLGLSGLTGCGSDQPADRSTTTSAAGRSDRGKPGITARIVLPHRTIRAGYAMHGTVVLTNTTGHAKKVPGCSGIVQVALANDRVTPSVFWTLCLRYFTIPRGTSRWPVDIRSSYLSCTNMAAGDRAGGDTPRCQPGGKPPTLPAGRYEARLFGLDKIVPRPTPIPVRVTADRCRAIRAVLASADVSAFLDPTPYRGLGGGAGPAPTSCSAHLEGLPDPEGGAPAATADHARQVNIVETDAPYGLLHPEQIGDYRVGPIEDGQLAEYTGTDLLAHHLTAYGLNDAQFRALIRSL